jgi:hypothetical protein
MQQQHRTLRSFVCHNLLLLAATCYSTVSAGAVNSSLLQHTASHCCALSAHCCYCCYCYCFAVHCFTDLFHCVCQYSTCTVYIATACFKSDCLFRRQMCQMQCSQNLFQLRRRPVRHCPLALLLCTAMMCLACTILLLSIVYVKSQNSNGSNINSG